MRKIIVVLLIVTGFKGMGNKISDAYTALSIYDYFKAKQLFYKSLGKYKPEAAFGLSHIYARNDNPFSDIDSAAKYIAITQAFFKDTVSYAGYHLNHETITLQSAFISKKGFARYVHSNSTDSLNHYLSAFFFADTTLRNRAFYKRDSIKLAYYSSYQSSDSIIVFKQHFPLSNFKNRATSLFYDFQYAENTTQKTQLQYQNFITWYPANPHVTDAEKNLYELVKKFHSPDSLHRLIKNYSTALTADDAWKLLYSLSVKSYNKDELTAFVKKYPDYPFSETIIKEISMSQRILLPLKDKAEKFGFIDTLGTWVIEPKYDDAMNFSEGFAAVCKNDSCFYINKEGNKVSAFYFEETESYKNGVAIVKKENTYYLVNRSGQFISQGFQDISTLQGKIFICKYNNKYGAINSKAEIIVPFIYTKLGNFKNNYAYYMSAKYGLVDLNNNTLEAKWDWISDVDTNGVAVVKKGNYFGLLSTQDQLLLPTEYDYASPCVNEIYIVVKKNLYGFYNVKQRCFVTEVDFDYDNSLEPDYYSNGKYFKLIKDDEVALVDANGKYSINFGTYSDLFFAKDDIIRIEKNERFGYVDRKLKPITAVEFDKAEDFKNKIAIVVKKGNSFLIDVNGKTIYTLKNGSIESDLIDNFYKVSSNGLTGLINAKGETVLNMEFDAIESLNKHLLIARKGSTQFLYNTNTKNLKQL